MLRRTCQRRHGGFRAAVRLWPSLAPARRSRAGAVPAAQSRLLQRNRAACRRPRRLRQSRPAADTQRTGVPSGGNGSHCCASAGRCRAAPRHDPSARGEPSGAARRSGCDRAAKSCLACNARASGCRDAGCRGAAAGAPPVDPVLAEVRRQLAERGQGQRRSRDRAALAAFYAARSEPLLWVAGDGFTAKARHAMAEIRKADDWGLSAASPSSCRSLRRAGSAGCAGRRRDQARPRRCSSMRATRAAAASTPRRSASTST